jgi:hypothetical protein
MEEKFYKFKVAEVHEFYAWVPAPDAETAFALLQVGDDPRIELASIDRYFTREEHLGPVEQMDHAQTLAMHAYLDAQAAEAAKRAKAKLIPFRRE